MKKIKKLFKKQKQRNEYRRGLVEGAGLTYAGLAIGFILKKFLNK